MAKPKSRRSISVAGLTYQRIHDFCRVRGCSISGLLEELIKTHLDAEGAPVPTELRPRSEPVSKPVYSDEIISQHFTF